MMRWQANTGRAQRVEEKENRPVGAENGAPGALARSRGGGLPLPGAEAARRRAMLPQAETEDVLLALVLYLLYRESGDRDWLVMLAGMFFA